MTFCLVFSLLITVPVLLFVYQQTDRLFHTRIVHRIDDRERNLLLGYRNGGISGLVRSINDEVETGIARGGAILLIDPQGRRIAGNIAHWPRSLDGPTRWTEMRLKPNGQARADLFAVRVFHLSDGYRLLLGTTVEDRERMRASLIEALLAALALAIPLGLLASFIVVRITNRQVNALGNLAEGIAAGDFSQRLDASREGEPFDKLAAVINGMLVRIEQLVGQLRLVTDALAHDLRSPLTRMRAHIESAAMQSCPESRGRSLEAIGNEIDGMLRLISATLEISRTEAGIGRQNFAPFDLGALLQDLCEMYQPLAEESGVSLEVGERRSIDYLGNRELMGRALSNLIDNALKYGRQGREVRIGVEENAGGIRLWVADRGPGIAEGRRDEALRRYGRLEEARTTEGSGLGLALVAAIARLHGGELRLEENAPGLKALMVLPPSA